MPVQGASSPIPPVGDDFFEGPGKVKVYLGLPDLRPDYVETARLLGARIMLSANALAKPWKKEMRDADIPHQGFKAPPQDGRLDDVRIALDSMGFTAMDRWGGYPVTPEQYFKLASSHRWDFWSSQDLCCEPKIASDDTEIVARLMETGWRYDRLSELADEARIPRPLKVIQGWEWHHYLISAEVLEVSSADRLVGIGSVCKRHSEGPAGVLTIIDRLDRELPPGVQFHLFGVTSEALQELASHPRVASMDSQAWGRKLRWDHHVGRNNLISARYAADFYRAQMQHVARGAAMPPRPPSEGDLPGRPYTWIGKSLEWRTRAAEVYSDIRNGETESTEFPMLMRQFEMAVEDGVDPRRRTWSAFNAALENGWNPVPEWQRAAAAEPGTGIFSDADYRAEQAEEPRKPVAWLFDDVKPDDLGAKPKRGKPPARGLAQAIAEDAPVPEPTGEDEEPAQFRMF